MTGGLQNDDCDSVLEYSFWKVEDNLSWMNAVEDLLNRPVCGSNFRDFHYSSKEMYLSTAVGRVLDSIL